MEKYAVELEKARKIAIAYPVGKSREIISMIYLGSEITKSGMAKDYYYDPHEKRYYYEPDFAKQWRIKNQNKRKK